MRDLAAERPFRFPPLGINVNEVGLETDYKSRRHSICRLSLDWIAATYGETPPVKTRVRAQIRSRLRAILRDIAGSPRLFATDIGGT
jgi:hypothetical protein